MKKNIIIAITLLLFTGCQHTDSLVDPYEFQNRKIFEFNEQADRYVIGPTVSVYRAVVPSPFRLGINNFYANISEISYAINFGLQGEWTDCYHSGLRFSVNSLFGVGGIFDMAYDLGLPRKRNDFGKTLYSWGYTESPYCVSPFFGPSTERDMFAFAVDKMLFNPLFYFQSESIKTDFFLLNFIETRSNAYEYLKGVTDTPYIEDKYLFIRDAFLQYRQYQLDNGNVNWDNFYDNSDEIEISKPHLEADSEPSLQF